MKKVMTIIIILMCAFDLKPNDSKVLSKRILYKTSKLVTKKALVYQTYLFNLKQYARFLNEIDFVNLLQNKSENDTLFILMSFGEFYEVNNFNLAIWNNKKEYFFSKQDTTGFENNNNKYNFDKLILFQADKKYGLFSSSTVFYVNKWDKGGLMKQYNDHRILGGDTYVAVRLTRTKYKFKIDYFSIPELFIFKTDYDPGNTGRDKYIKRVKDINNLPFCVEK